MSERAAPLPDGAALAREIHLKPGVGITAHVLQGRGLEILRIRLDQPALIFVDRGIKSVRSERGTVARAMPGQAVLIDGNQTVDFTNSVPDGEVHEARWLLFDDALVEDAHWIVFEETAFDDRRHLDDAMTCAMSCGVTYAGGFVTAGEQALLLRGPLRPAAASICSGHTPGMVPGRAHSTLEE